jgi:hypothetical protein
MAGKPKLPIVAPTLAETQDGISVSNPFGDLQTYAAEAKAIGGWQTLQDSVNVTLRERLSQSTSHLSAAWSSLSRAR